MKKQYNLLAPGPVPIPESILNVLSEPMIHHRVPEFAQILKESLQGLKHAFQTGNDVFILTATGSGAMEAAISNFLNAGDEVVIVQSGKFGDRWADMAKAYQLNVKSLKVEWGKSFSVDEVMKLVGENTKAVFTQYCETSTATLHPIKELAVALKNTDTLVAVDAITAIGACPLEMDNWGLDIVVAGSQKAFMMPTGLSFLAASEKAWRAYENSNLPKYYFDLKKEQKANKNSQTHFSSSVTHIRALNEVLKTFADDGLKKQIDRCQKMMEATHLFAKEIGLTLLSDSPSPSVTAVNVPENIDGAQLRRHIEEKYNVTFMGGQDHLKGKIIRVGHLGGITNENFLQGLQAFGQGLIDFNYNLSSEKLDETLKLTQQKLES